jgi:phosphonate ABC transporter permease subunit PhnE
MRSIGLGIAIFVGLVIYAYGFQVTKVNLAETRSPIRQTQLVRILRAIAQPDILAYAREEFLVSAPIQVPCPEGDYTPPEPDTSGPYMILTPPCADPGAEITVEGFNFEPNTRGPINFIPPSEVSLQMGSIETDAQGHFLITVKLPRRPHEETQHVRAVTRRNVGLPYFTKTAHDTWDKIIETVFLALLATTVGTALSIPLSFIAASNLMRPITSPLTGVALSLLALPIGLALGAAAADWMGSLSTMLTANMAVSLSGLVAGPLVVWGTARWALPQAEASPPGLGLRMARLAALIVATLVSLLALYLLASLAMTLGNALAPRLGAFGFLATFVRDLGDILGSSLKVVSALGGAAVMINAGGRFGQFISERAPVALKKGLNIVLATGAGAILLAALGGAINWLYQINDPLKVLWGPAAIGGVAGLALAVRYPTEVSLPIGSVVYYVTRTVLNALRSIEPLIMVIVFAVWVGIGPFAGTLALALHTIAALAKLYSEQVESILPGPLEAVTATGATRLQTIVYAVVPQIIPPYISFTMYRWDINVRMSTIIGFAGGGGIGFLLQQNINLLNYRAASAQMLAIAIVVATMDYVSAKLRERAV